MPLDPAPRFHPPHYHRASWALVAIAMIAAAGATVSVLLVLIGEAPAR